MDKISFESIWCSPKTFPNFVKTFKNHTFGYFLGYKVQLLHNNKSEICQILNSMFSGHQDFKILMILSGFLRYYVETDFGTYTKEQINMHKKPISAYILDTKRTHLNARHQFCIQLRGCHV